MNAMRATAFLCSSVLLLSCSGATPPRAQYLLRAETETHSARAQAPIRVGLGRVALAPYLNQTGIVVQTTDGQVRVARQHHWAEPLDAGLRSFLRADISNTLGFDVNAGRPDGAGWDYTIEVYVDRLHGTMNGTAVLDASYRIAPRDTNGAAIEYRFSRTTTLARQGYPGLVDAEAGLVRQLAAAIAESIRSLNAP
jgi:uncharacterized lipoprotein YmbA